VYNESEYELVIDPENVVRILMANLSLNSEIIAQLASVEGKSPDEKLLTLLKTYLVAQLRACEQEISEYEIKYRSTYDEFAKAWEQDKIPGRYSHEVERDYMEWEGLITEKEQWLKRLQVLPENGSFERSNESGLHQNGWMLSG
jgi:hypothetical protein